MTQRPIHTTARTRALVAGCLLIATAGAAEAGPAYTLQTIQFPTDPTFTQVLGINDAGNSVGFHGATINQGFSRSKSGVFTGLNFPGAVQTQAVGIAGNGDKVGFFVDAAGTTHGFYSQPGQFGVVDQAGTAFNQLLGINNSRIAVGYSSLDPAGMTLQRALSVDLNHTSFTDINALLRSNVNSQATGINTKGAIVGFYQPTTATSLGFLLAGGILSTIDPFASAFTQALGVNDMGEIVGSYQDMNGVQHGYVGTQAGGYSSFDPVGSLSTTVNGVNDLGQIAGFFTDPGGNVDGFIATPVPEPAALDLLVGGLLSLTLVRQFRRTARQGGQRLLPIALLGLGVGATAAEATTIDTFNFRQAGYTDLSGQPGELDGSFSGIVDAGGFLTLANLQSYHAAFVDNPGPNALTLFSQGLPSFFTYNMAFGNSSLGVVMPRIGLGDVACIGAPAAFQVGGCINAAPAGTAVNGFIGGVGAITAEFATVTLVSSLILPPPQPLPIPHPVPAPQPQPIPMAVPEPASLALLGAGLLGVGLTRRVGRGYGAGPVKAGISAAA